MCKNVVHYRASDHIEDHGEHRLVRVSALWHVDMFGEVSGRCGVEADSGLHSLVSWDGTPSLAVRYWYSICVGIPLFLAALLRMCWWFTVFV